MQYGKNVVYPSVELRQTNCSLSSSFVVSIINHGLY